jgi:uncharacterized protein YbjT (DUF2867 family)
MRVIVFGATGMVGQGVLRECLLDDSVSGVLTLGRTATGQTDPKLRELLHTDFLDFTGVDGEFADHQACFFCLGVSSAGMREPAYRRITYDFTLAAARAVLRRSPDLTFVYVSGQGTNAEGRRMWARVKGQTEHDLIALTSNAYMFRPGFIQPMHGIRSRTAAYRIAYLLATPLFAVLRAAFPGAVTSTDRIGRAMINVARHGAPVRVLNSRDLNRLAAAGQVDR